MADTPMSGLPALPGIPLPALPSLSSPAPSSSSATPQPPLPTNKRPTPNTPDTADGPPKRKRARKSVVNSVGGGTPGETTPAGPGKNWRKGLKGNLAGVGLEGAMAAATRETSTKPSTPVAAAKAAASPAPPPVPLPPLIPFHPTGRTASHLVGAPPKLATQFLPPQILEPGAPRPRRWARAKMEFRNITGGTITLLAWQGDTHSSYSEHLNRNSIDELASPPPAGGPSSRLPPGSSASKPSLSRTPLPLQQAPQSTPIAPGAQYQPHSQDFSPYPVPSPLTQPTSSNQTYQPSNLAPPTIPPFHNHHQSQSPSSSSSNTSKPSASELAPPTYPTFPTTLPNTSSAGGRGAGNA